jgi:hypothetical protein
MQPDSEHIGQVNCDTVTTLLIEQFDGEDKSDMNDLSMVNLSCRSPQKSGELAIIEIATFRTVIYFIFLVQKFKIQIGGAEQKISGTGSHVCF